MEPGIKLLKKIVFGHSVRAYLVGGYLRDLLLGREPFDMDLVVSDKVEEISGAFARETGGSLVELDQKRGIYRVVTPGNGACDFSLLKGGDIRADLSCRDFTINALAYPLEDMPVAENMIIDPLGGRADLEQRILRIVSEEAFIDDPLRILRAVRLLVQLDDFGFRVDDNTGDYMRQYRMRLDLAARERIREELIKCFRALDDAEQVLYIEREFGLFSFFMSAVVEDRRPFLSGVVSLGILLSLLPEGKRDDYLLKLATLFYFLLRDEKDSGEWFDRLCFSRREISCLKGIFSGVPELLRVYQGRHREREIYELVRSLGDDLDRIYFLGAVVYLSEFLYLSFSSYWQERDCFFSFLNGLREAASRLEEVRDNLPGGDWIMEVLSLPEGPEVGRILSDLEIEVACGQIEDKEELEQYLLAEYG